MVTGDAAGVAASLAIKEGISFRELSSNKELVEALRTQLDEQGAFVKHIETTYPYQGEWYDAEIQSLMDYGLVVGGYTNDLGVDKVATVQSLMNMLKGAVERTEYADKEQLVQIFADTYSKEFAKENKNLDLEKASATIAALFLDEQPGSTNWAKLVEANIISQETAKNIDSTNHELTFKELYAICGDVIQYLETK
jgi:hypothetical protein